ncbi:D-alanyl-D-alanine carboxypeptidase [Paracoccus kondratievae]|uniref:serine-type D-Ala-D-Ala carboxypeptidase n=1 Tax=Paracoccus kondratievae TaxID=135740 RepID=A0AAD3RV83_9RHOB|nr:MULTISPECIES: D-alanyl-D-alanine carboxypeptidase family protein [Paracoccus]QFQ86510.1 D-alanyl-D-alanine carboxypeptidase [Paracoccus kondratievae]GLK65581.1 D-alanyl-D-alanine carboxypeptidase [Paracoccus kondratievae]SMG09401.1 D-alanyl-D-alanine carboxypeptidase (penicillin-binding protein 5/6) [Paracoccus sp. J56]
MRALTLHILALVMMLALPARAFDTNARAAWVYDVATGTVLMEKNADEALPPASMSKLMTIYMLFEALHEGRVQLDTRLPVSTKARQMQGSTMFLNEQDRPTVEELIKGIIVLSGNDACVVVAEGLAGTEEAFARQMTERGRQLGLTQSTFANASGWPDPRHRMSAHDLGILAQHLISDFPELYRNFAIEEFRFDNRAPANRFNRNPLLKLGIGADGLKTGHTQEAGYGLVGSAVQGDRRVIFVITGLPSEKARAEEAERIVNWAYRQFTMKTIVPKGEIVAQAPVWLGSKSRVGLTTADGVKVLIPAGSQSGVTAEAVFRGPIEAPITQGDRLGELVVTIPGAGQSRLPLLAASDVARTGVLGRMQGAAMRLGEKAYKAVRN